MIQFMINLCEIMKFVSNINEGNGKIQANMPIMLHCDIKPENIMVTKHGKDIGFKENVYYLVLDEYGGKHNLEYYYD